MYFKIYVHADCVYRPLAVAFLLVRFGGGGGGSFNEQPDNCGPVVRKIVLQSGI